MAQMVPQYDIGERFGTGLGQGLALLAQNKMQHFAQQQQQKQNRQLLNQAFPESSEGIRDLLATQDPKDWFKFIQALGDSGLLEGNQGQESLSSPTQESMQSLSQPEQPQPQVNTQQLLEMLGVKLPGDLSQFFGQAPKINQPQQATPVQQQLQQPKTSSQGKKPSVAQAIANYQTPQMKQAERHFQAKQEQLDKNARFKETKAERKEIIEKARAARSNLHDLERLEDLEKEGKLDTPGYIEFLKRTGLDIPALMNPGSEEFQKIANNFLRDAKTYFGARVSNFEIEQFLKTIPSLSQSPEGRKRVIANLKNLSRSALEYNNALKEVMSENKGVPPFDLLEQVDDKVEKRMDKLSDMFKKDLEKPVPASQNRLVTALQSVLGSAIGAPGALINKIGNIGSSVIGI
jgi:hypothetical protein